MDNLVPMDLALASMFLKPNPIFCESQLYLDCGTWNIYDFSGLSWELAIERVGTLTPRDRLSDVFEWMPGLPPEDRTRDLLFFSREEREIWECELRTPRDGEGMSGRSPVLSMPDGGIFRLNIPSRRTKYLFYDFG